MTASALLKYGIDHLSSMYKGLIRWMEMRDFANIAEMQGLMSQEYIADPTAFERANYIKVLGSYADLMQ